MSILTSQTAADITKFRHALWFYRKWNLCHTGTLIRNTHKIPRHPNTLQPVFNSTSDCTILILLLHIITYDVLLHVSTLIRIAITTSRLYTQRPRTEFVVRYTTNVPWMIILYFVLYILTITFYQDQQYMQFSLDAKGSLKMAY